MARPLYIRTQEEILDRILDAVSRGDQGDEFNEYMRCARFVPLVLRAVYEDTVEADWIDHDLEQKVLKGLISPVDCDDSRAIDQLARGMLPQFERVMRRFGGPNRSATMMRQYRAYKWLLGHADADTFLGADPNPIKIYEYLMKQITSGQWTRMTARKKGKDATHHREKATRSIHSLVEAQQVG
jgi:hypothetical protein